MTKELDKTAQRIAEKGRDALIERLRPAFEEAAAAHADFLELDADKLERMVQQAADRADGLQWRRALATVATEELGIGLGEALGHPVVERAQTIVGAPSYEESLAAIAAGSPPPAGAEPPGAAAPPAAGAEPPGASAAAPTAEPDAEPEAAADAGEKGPRDVRREANSQGSEALPITVAAVHLDGLSELDGHGELELQFTEDGLDVAGGPEETILARFIWSEIDGIEVQPGRGRMIRRRAAPARVILSASGRHARFEARDGDPEELKRRLAPALTKLDAQ